MGRPLTDCIRPESYLDCRKRLVDLIVGLKEQQCLDEISELLASGRDPMELLECCIQGMRGVGKRFEEGRYFISGLIMAGDIMRQITELLEPRLPRTNCNREGSTILLGTIAGDIHDLGKNLFAVLARYHGFEVSDLGVDVAPETFVSEAKKTGPDLIGISCVLTTSLPDLKSAVELLKVGFSRSRPPVVIGGTCIDEQICRHVRADHWARDAADGVRKCRQLVRERDRLTVVQ